MNIRTKGAIGEQCIVQKLIKKGYQIRDCNYSKPFGEVDIIAQKEDTIAFIEVKYRKNPLFDSASIITPSKQKKIIAVAKEYVTRHTLNCHTIRFDVALISEIYGTVTIDYIENAFQGV